MQVEQPKLTEREKNESVLTLELIDNGAAFPMATVQALSVVGLLGYAAGPAEARQAGFDCENDWTRENVLDFCDHLERQRSWTLTSRHDSKKSAAERERDRRLEAESEFRVLAWMAMPLNELISSVIDAEDFKARKSMGGVLLTRLMFGWGHRLGAQAMRDATLELVFEEKRKGRERKALEVLEALGV